MRIKKVVIIDDDNDFMKEMEELFVQKDFEVAMKNNTDDILSFVKITNPDLVILDLKINGLSGIEVSEMLKNDLKTKGLPIILLTNYYIGDIDKSKYGIDICLNKNMKPEIMFDEIEKIERERNNQEHKKAND